MEKHICERRSTTTKRKIRVRGKRHKNGKEEVTENDFIEYY